MVLLLVFIGNSGFYCHFRSLRIFFSYNIGHNTRKKMYGLTSASQSLQECLQHFMAKEKITRKKPVRIFLLKAGEKFMVNHNLPGAWYNGETFYFDFDEKLNKEIDFRDYSVCDSSNRYTFVVDRSEGIPCNWALWFVYRGKLLVDGFSPETLSEVIEKDGRFKENVVKSRITIENRWL